MQATINGEPIDAQISLRRDQAHLDEEQLYVNDMCVARVTHSRADDIPVILQIDEHVAVEVDPQTFYTIEGMHHDWQPGAQAESLGAP
jgi:hypothetical protein